MEDSARNFAPSDAPSRRGFLAALSAALVAARQALGGAGGTETETGSGGLGICSFSCHRAWLALRENLAPVPFSDGPSFYEYVRTLGADGAQTSVATVDEPAARRFRETVERTGGYYEGDVRLPRDETGLPAFEREVKLAAAAGATVARTFLTGNRRYETFTTMEEFKAFHADAFQRLALVEPVVRKHRLRLAVENHKDFTCAEQAALLRRIDSEWVGVNFDTGNNVALLEDPHESLAALAPYVMSVHLKDMAVQPHENGFLLSEVVCGEGFLDLPRLAAALRKANPAVRLNLEMATRDPLLIPCLTDGYFATFPDRKPAHLASAMKRVADHPPRRPPPSIQGKPMARQLADEEANNRQSLRWMHDRLAGG